MAITTATQRRAFPDAAMLREAMARRVELMRSKPPADVHGPQARLLWGELATPIEPLCRLFREPFALPRTGHPQVVMLLPGFGTHPLRMRYMARQLEQADAQHPSLAAAQIQGPGPSANRPCSS